MQIGGRASGIAALALAGLLAMAAPALAHNSLTGSDPEDGAALEQGPDEVRLTFRASLDPGNADLAVTGPDGYSVVTGELAFDGASVTIPVDARAGGWYEASYEVLASDGDWVEGSIEFTVAVQEAPAPTPAPTPARTSSPAPSPVQEAVTIGSETGQDAGGPAWWVWALLAVLVVAGAGYGGYRLRRS